MSDKITFVLKHHEIINSLGNCPLLNEEKTMKLFRWCENDIIKDADLLPLAIDNPSRTFIGDSLCLSWGISTYDCIEASQNAVKVFSKKKREKLKSIYSIEVDKSMAVKHQSGTNKNHYTVYPYENRDLVNSFSKETI